MLSIIKPDPHWMEPGTNSSKPAPIMDVTIRHKDINLQAKLHAFLDTGCDVTVLAPWSVNKLETSFALVLPSSPIFVGDKITIAYELELSFNSGLNWYAPDDGLIEWATSIIDYPWSEDMLIGRDILCKFVFCCDGPSKTFTLRCP